MSTDDMTIPQDFLDIDADETHWIMTGVSGSNEGRRFPDPKLFCVPNSEHHDMTDAMMSEIPGLDDDVQPLKLRDNRFTSFCMAYLMQDGNLAVPGGRYGNNTSTCAEIAIAMAYVMQYHNGEPITYYSLRSDMSQVVNGSDGVATLLSESQYIFDEQKADVNIKDLLGEEYEPQTPAEKLVAHINDNIGWVDANLNDDGSVTIHVVDEDGATNLCEAMNITDPNG